MAGALKASSYVNSGGGFGVSLASQDDALALPVSAAVGDRIVVIASVAATSGTGVTYVINDNRNAGNYTQDFTITGIPGSGSGEGNAIRLSVHSKPVTVAGATTVTVHVSNPGGAFMFGGCQAAIFTGLLASDPSTDGTAGAQAATLGNLAASGNTASTTAASELVVVGYHDTGWNFALGTATTGYTVAGERESDGSNWQSSMQYKVDSGATGVQSASLSLPSNSAWSIATVVYKLAAAGGAQDTPELYGRPRLAARQMVQLLAQ